MQGWVLPASIDLVSLADEVVTLVCAYIAIFRALQLAGVLPKKGKKLPSVVPSNAREYARAEENVWACPVQRGVGADAVAARRKPPAGRADRGPPGLFLPPAGRADGGPRGLFLPPAGRTDGGPPGIFFPPRSAESLQVTGQQQVSALVGAWVVLRHGQAGGLQNLSIEVQPSLGSMQAWSQNLRIVGSLWLTDSSSTPRMTNRMLVWDAAINCLYFELDGKRYNFANSWTRRDTEFACWQSQSHPDLIWQRPVAGMSGEGCQGSWCDTTGLCQRHQQCNKGTAEEGGSHLNEWIVHSRGEGHVDVAGPDEAVAGLTVGAVQELAKHAGEAVWNGAPLGHPKAKSSGPETSKADGKALAVGGPQAWAVWQHQGRMQQNGQFYNMQNLFHGALTEGKLAGSERLKPEAPAESQHGAGTEAATSASTLLSVSACPSSSSLGAASFPRGRWSAQTPPHSPERVAPLEQDAVAGSPWSTCRVQTFECTRRRWRPRPDSTEVVRVG